MAIALALSTGVVRMNMYGVLDLCDKLTPRHQIGKSLVRPRLAVVGLDDKDKDAQRSSSGVVLSFV